MDLQTEYLGLKLESPLMPGASPLADSLDVVRQLEDAGASAIVMRSLFEEQITREMTGNVYAIETHAESYGEATSYFPAASEFSLGPDEYLDQLRCISEAVAIPVIGVGGIRTARDAREYLAAGASLVAIGTAALADPRIPERVARELARG